MPSKQVWNDVRGGKGLNEELGMEDRNFMQSNLEEIKKMAIQNGRMFDFYVQELLIYMNKE
jgi:hypothetical protein